MEAPISESSSTFREINKMKIKGELGNLILKQKASLLIEKEKLEKKKNAFNNSFRHALPNTLPNLPV